MKVTLPPYWRISGHVRQVGNLRPIVNRPVDATRTPEPTR